MAAHQPRKRFGQHFLADTAVIDRIVTAIAPRPRDLLVEIGPGLGALTEPLLERVGRLTVIELDRELVARLQCDPRLHVVAADVLTVNFTQLQQMSAQAGPEGAQPLPKLRVVGNLPYNISTPILFHLLAAAEVIEDQHFMLQKEVVDRIAAAPSTHAYGRLSVMLQWRYEIETLFDVPPSAFEPPPKVISAVLRMMPRTTPAALDAGLLEEMVKVAFSQRRKLLRHTLGRWLDARGYGGVFDVHRRAEEVPVNEYVALAQAVETS